MKYPKLYKEKNGKTLWWEVETTKNNVNGMPLYIVKHGYVGGATQVTSTDVLKGKNVGRANETTAEQQCELEAKSEWNKHKDRKGYVENLQTSKVDTSFRPVRPMLAHSYDDYPNKLVLPCYIQKKYDGICCLAHIDNKCEARLISRTGTEWNTLDHLKDEIKKLGITNIVLHGELYKHDTKFEDIISGVKRDEVNEKSGDMEYIVYDAAIAGSYEKRLSVLSFLLSPEWSKNAKIKVATTTLVKSRDEIDSLHDKFVADKYEGAILRNPEGLYEYDKRSFNLLKYKKFKDDDFEIIGAEEGKGKNKDMCVFWLKTKDGNEFKATPEGTAEHRHKLWADWQSGKIKAGMIATVKYFTYTRTEKPVPKMSTFKTIRHYE